MVPDAKAQVHILMGKPLGQDNDKLPRLRKRIPNIL